MARLSRSPDAGFKIFEDSEADWVFNRTLQFSNEKAAESGECLYAARRIDPKDLDSWITEWANLAARVESLASASLEKGHEVSACEAFLRASNYYRTAEYGTPPYHPRFDELWKKSVKCFHEVCKLSDPPIQIINVEFEGKDLPGYFWRPDDSDTLRPTLIAAGGNDSSLEELFYWIGMAAVRRGYNFFAFEHPGHRGTLHLYDDSFKRPDYEVPYKTAIDYLETLPGVDERIAMTGYSFGGHTTCRVAAFEKRIKAIAPNPPIYHEPMFADHYKGKWTKIPDWLIDRIVTKAIKRSPLSVAFADYTLWTFGVKESIVNKGVWKKWLELGSTGFTVKDDLHRITCPALLLVGDNEGERWLQLAHEFYDGISSEVKKLHIFSLERDGSNDHCQLDNRSRGNQVLFDWLDEVFDYRLAEK
ncbi:MAG: alpha/beta hydrolase family protein [Candidatus Thorarchaeota archaeon]